VNENALQSVISLFFQRAGLYKNKIV